MTSRRLAIAAVALTVAVLQPSTAMSETIGVKPSDAVGPVREAHRPAPPEVVFEPATEQVIVRVSPRHLNAVRFPFPVRERLAVFEDGVRQPEVSVDVEHSPITLAVLIENGGRSHQLNASVTADAGLLVRPLLDILDRNDRLAVFAYDETVRTIVDFDTPHEEWSFAVGRLPKPRFAEANFYDATLTVLDRLAGVTGRKALLIFSTGIDTFSRARFDDVVARAEQVKVPVYVFNLAELARRRVSSSSWGLLARVDWKRCEQQLERLATVSGGRAYLQSSSSDVPAVYDELIEDLRVRYVLTYRPNVRTAPGARVVQIAVIDSPSREAVDARDTSRRGNATRVIAEASYTPANVTAEATALANIGQRR